MRPIFVHKDDRVEALVGVVGLAPLVFGVMRKMALAALRPAAIRTVGRQLATFCVGFSLAILSSMVFRKQIEGLDKTAPELRGLPLKPLAERAVALDGGVAVPSV